MVLAETQREELDCYAEYLWGQAQTATAQKVEELGLQHLSTKGYLFGGLARYRQNVSPLERFCERPFTLASDADVLIMAINPTFQRALHDIFVDQVGLTDYNKVHISLLPDLRALNIKRISQYWIKLF